MSENSNYEAKLPNNTHSELKEGEVYVPVMSPNSNFAEITTYSETNAELVALKLGSS